jgi:YidC/Oxa1 family membrane protein insertase
MSSSMMMIMPFMTAFFAFSVPAGMGLYWIVGNVIQILQQLYMNKYIIKKKEVVNK